MAVSTQQLAEELQIFGLDYEDSLLEKLAELCVLYRQTEDGMVSELIAFCTSAGKTCLTVDILNSFEYEVLNKKLSKAWHSASKDSGHAGTRDIVSIQELYPFLLKLLSLTSVFRIEAEEEEETLLSSYTTPSKGPLKRVSSTPETPLTKRSVAARSPRQLLSPSSFSPSATPSQKYTSRTNRGEVVTTFGSAQGLSWSGRGGSGSVSLKVVGDPEPLTGSYKAMFQQLMGVREVLTSKIEELGSELKEHHKIEAFTPLLVPAQEPVILLGQIGCDSNGKLNSKSVILEGDQEHSYGAQIPVDLSELKEYSLFPGQVVIMEGFNTTGRRLTATKLYEGVPLPFYQPTEEEGASEQTMVVVACGPYTTSDSITYDPLLDLIAIINRDQPDVCILFGPFLDAKHEQVENCKLTSPFEDVFKQCLRTVIEGTRRQQFSSVKGATKIKRRCVLSYVHQIQISMFMCQEVAFPSRGPASSGSHLVFVPSLRDVHHEPVYPQPPFTFSELSREDKKRVQFVSEPCSLSINGVMFGLTSTDLLFHIGAEEIFSSSGTSDRFSRVLKHILTQRSYYPLYPPHEDMAIDYENFYTYAQLPVTPDVFIVPSELRYFVKGQHFEAGSLQPRMFWNP
ncbi:DNA polymerase alpha subunit B isoform X3 [Mus musculus]|uniref:DNA polymerase alpha subunit B isoform X3 n=1 Tax=Mus musculus TaxID=10090 RepID=UPI0005ABAC92|nr:DNA polymerase alpha subunit B isoform X3 [Mus musculus]|eukprot:XP_011246910.1 PREDICTED: DNA polymerase alpha subunit B isoform X3 [Mus musculus]